MNYGGTEVTNLKYELYQVQSQLRTIQVEIKDLQVLVLEIRDFMAYVDATAPELRTAYHVAKRME